MNPNVFQPSYNEAGLLTQLDVWFQQPTVPTTLLAAATASAHAVTGILYNARRQRAQLALGNGTVTTYSYDPQTFRLVNLTTSRPGNFAADQQGVQNLSYYYDPAGNPTRVRDDADTQNVIFFNNQRVEPSTDYTYDPIYRLTSATGREHLGQTNGTLKPPQLVTDDDSFRMALPQPGDGTAMGLYTESYAYDQVGNILAVLHQVSSGSWTRPYAYNEPSQITPTELSNRLSATGVEGDPTGGPYSAKYTYDAHGNMVTMPHLSALTWDEQDRLRSTTTQIRNTGTPGTTYYRYDGGGQRVRKVTDRQVSDGQTPTRVTERIYLGGVELYREFAGDGTTVALQRETLHIMDGTNRIALVETRTIGTDPALTQLVRYQYANHLGSASLELDNQAQIISYEEYFPYGSTSYQAVRNQTDTPKRYRYTGTERDEENALDYHRARYCAPWLGRWVSCDPAGLVDGENLYCYTRNNPIKYTDPQGSQAKDPKLNDMPEVLPPQNPSGKSDDKKADKSDDEKEDVPDDTTGGSSGPPGVNPGNFPFANPTSSLGIMPKDALDLDFTLGLTLTQGIPDPAAQATGGTLLGGGLSTLQFSFRNQVFVPGLDMGLAVGANSVSQGGSSASDFAQSYYLTPTLHYGTQNEKSGWGKALYLQGTAGFRQGAGVPSNYTGLLGAQATGVLGYEPNNGPWYVDLNATAGVTSVGQFSAGPTLSDPAYAGLQASVQRNFKDQQYTVLAEGFGYGEHGASFTDATGTAGPSAWGVRYGVGVGFARNYLETSPFTHQTNQTSTIGVNLDYSRETVFVGSAGSTPASSPTTNTLTINITLAYRKL
jgi:RHS repeat-associated protein